MKTITYAQLVALKACSGQLRLFKQLFGDSVEVTESVAKAYGAQFDISWMARNLLTSPQYKEYSEKCAPLLKECYEKSATLWEEYSEKCAPLLKEYYEKRAPLRKEHAEKYALLCKEYEEKRAPLWKEYYEKWAPLDKEYDEKRALLFVAVYNGE